MGSIIASSSSSSPSSLSSSYNGTKKMKSSKAAVGSRIFQLFCSTFVHKMTHSRLATLLALVAACIVYIGHRIASYEVNTRTWVKAPINDIYRTCPKPPYTVMSQTGQSAGKVCITTLTDAKRADTIQRLVRWRNFDSLLEMTWPNKRNYANLHGYHLFDESDSLDISRPPSWSKIVAARRLLTEERCDWVFWLDADTVIMNSTVRLEDFLPAEQGKDLLITIQKGGSYNAGAWILRNTPWAMEFLDTWWNKKEFVQPKGLSVSGDNDALKDYLTHLPQEYFNAHILVPHRCTFNSVTKFLTPEEASTLTQDQLPKQFWYLDYEFYHKGDFVAHVAGRNNKITTTAMLLKDAA